MSSFKHNRPVAQILNGTRPIFHNAPFCNRNVHMCTFLLQNGALWDICLLHCGICKMCLLTVCLCLMALQPNLGWVGLWGFLWWTPSAKRKDHHGVSSGWSSVWHCSNTGLSSSQYEQISIILGVWPFCLTPFFFRSITFWRAYGWIIFPLLTLLSFFWLTYYCSIGLCFSARV